MNKRIFLFFGIFAALLLGSCVSQDKVRMVGVENFIMVDETRFEVTIRIENLNGKNLAIKNANLSLVDDQMKLIELSLAEKVIIPRRSEQGLVFPIVMRMSDPKVLATLKAKRERPLMVRGQVTGQSGIFSKSYKVGPMSVEEFLAKLDESNRELIKGFIY